MPKQDATSLEFDPYGGMGNSGEVGEGRSEESFPDSLRILGVGVDCLPSLDSHVQRVLRRA